MDTKEVKADYEKVFDNVYPLPTIMICENKKVKKYVGLIDRFIKNQKKNEKYNKQADFDIGLVEIVTKMFDDFYSQGLKDMDKMHCIVNKQLAK